MTGTVMWFRDDLRLADNAALTAAAGTGEVEVTALYVVDPAAWDRHNQPRTAYRLASLRALAARIGGIEVAHGDPAAEVVRVARETCADEVHVQAATDPYGRRRDEKVAASLAATGVQLVATDTAYAIAPGTVLKNDATGYRVFSPFANEWSLKRLDPPLPAPKVNWIPPRATAVWPDPATTIVDMPAAGEEAALARWRDFAGNELGAYERLRNDPGADATSRAGIALTHGEIHPRTLLADLSRDDHAFGRQLIFREFYADVLWHRPDTAHGYYNQNYAAMEYDEPADDFDAWVRGQTGIPIVDAGMRQLLAEGWMHNRVRMIVASFLVKDLHLEWQHGADYFLRHLIDADLANNQHGWQWVAGCGTNAAPYFRVFNPTLQGKKFDPHGDYVRRWVPELADVNGAQVHEPWLLTANPPPDYPPPLVDHAEERRESLRRYDRIRKK